MSDEHRTKIANSQILKCLIAHASGEMEMSASQVSAGLGLLRKVLPDLSQTTIEGGDNPVQIDVVRREIVRPRPDNSDG